MAQIQAETKVADATIAVQDGEVLVYFAEGDGSSEPLTPGAVEKLEFIAGMARIILEETR